MPLTLPFPGQPAANSSLSSNPILQNINAIAQAIQAFDGSQVNAGSIVAAALAAGINPNTILSDTIKPFVQSGCVWTTVSGLNGTMSSGVIYKGPSGSILRVPIAAVGSNTFTASKDTYVDIDYLDNVTYNAVANGASAPSLTANSIRVAKVVTNGSAITSISQTGSDSVGNAIYPTNPNGINSWVPWTPVFTNMPVTVNLANFLQVGKLVFFKLQVNITGAVTGGVSFTAPTNVGGNESLQLTFAHGWCQHGAGNFTDLYGAYSSATNLVLVAPQVSGSNLVYGAVAAALPFTWANGDSLGLQGFYEAA